MKTAALASTTTQDELLPWSLLMTQQGWCIRVISSGRSDWLRLVCLNLDNLAIEINESKEVSLFQSISECGIDILLPQELGLHWSNLSWTKQWHSQVERFLNPKCTQTRYSHKVHDTTGTRSHFRGKGGMVLWVVSLYGPCASSGGERIAWSQHKAHFNDQNDD